jgi:hypothetical protein
MAGYVATALKHNELKITTHTNTSPTLQGDANWIESEERFGKMQPLNLLPFLPQDNNLTAQSQTAVTAANNALGKVLCMPFSEFASELLHDASVAEFLDSFLRHRRRPHEQELQAKLGKLAAAESQVRSTLRSSGALDSNMQLCANCFSLFTPLSFHLQALIQLTRRVLALLLRLTTSNEIAAAYPDRQVYSKELAQSALLKVPAVLDICAIYGSSNRDLLHDMLGAVQTLVPSWQQDLRSTAASIAAVLQVRIAVVTMRYCTKMHTTSPMLESHAEAASKNITSPISTVLINHWLVH